MTKELRIKFDNVDIMRSIMDTYGDSDHMFFGTNDEGEDVQVSVSHDSIVTITYQKDGSVRRGTLYYDGIMDVSYEK